MSQVTEVALHKRQTRLVGRNVGHGLGVLVKTEQTPLGPQARKDFTAVSAAAKSHVHVNAVGLDLQAVNRRFQEHRNVIYGCRNYFVLSVFRYHS